MRLICRVLGVGMMWRGRVCSVRRSKGRNRSKSHHHHHHTVYEMVGGFRAMREDGVKRTTVCRGRLDRCWRV